MSYGRSGTSTAALKHKESDYKARCVIWAFLPCLGIWQAKYHGQLSLMVNLMKALLQSLSFVRQPGKCPQGFMKPRLLY